LRLPHLFPLVVKTIDNIGDAEIQDVAIPTGIPIIYKFEKLDDKLTSIPPRGDRQTACQVHMKGLFLEKPGLLKEALVRELEWSKQVPGYNASMGREKTSMTSLERSLFKLAAERELGAWAGELIDPLAVPEEDDGSDGNNGKPIRLVEDDIWELGIKEMQRGNQFDPDSPVFRQEGANDDSTVVKGSVSMLDGLKDDEETGAKEEATKVNLISSLNPPCGIAMPSAAVVPGLGSTPIRRDACKYSAVHEVNGMVRRYKPTN
jgi:hypothetical protein